MPSPILPTTYTPTSYGIKSKVNVLRSEAISGKILTRRVGGQRFEFSLAFQPMTREQFSPIHAFLMEQEGSQGIFYIQIPTFSNSATAAGEYVNYSGSTKLFMLKSDGTTLPFLYPSTTVSHAVTVVNDSGVNKFAIDGVTAPALTIRRGNTYIFNQDDASNSGHPIHFADSSNSQITSGVTVTGTPGIYGAKTVFTVPNSIGAISKYYCTVHGNGMGGWLNAINANASPTYSSSPVYARVSLTNNIQEVVYNADGLVRFEIDLVERL